MMHIYISYNSHINTNPFWQDSDAAKQKNTSFSPSFIGAVAVGGMVTSSYPL